MNTVDGDPAPQPRTPPSATIGFAVTLLVLAVIIALVLFAHPTTAPAPAVVESYVSAAKPGTVKHIGSAAEHMGIACLSTLERFNDMQAAAAANNFGRVGADISDAAILRPGDRVRVVDRFGPNKKNAKLQIETGGSAGRACFTEIDAPDFLK